MLMVLNPSDGNDLTTPSDAAARSLTIATREGHAMYASRPSRPPRAAPRTRRQAEDQEDADIPMATLRQLLHDAMRWPADAMDRRRRVAPEAPPPPQDGGGVASLPPSPPAADEYTA